jgi:hypothetical protein
MAQHGPRWRRACTSRLGIIMHPTLDRSRWPARLKRRDDWTVVPNLVDSAGTRDTFTWAAARHLPVVTATVSADHRAVNGHQAGPFRSRRPPPSGTGAPVTRAEIREAVVRILVRIAPESRGQALAPSVSLRDQLDIDSMDVAQLRDRAPRGARRRDPRGRLRQARDAGRNRGVPRRTSALIRRDPVPEVRKYEDR